ncbi:MAG: hypothetical protein ACR2M3_09845 [Thermomicrobiales bacterium]
MGRTHNGMASNGGTVLQFFIELLLWHLIIAAFLVGALILSRGAQQSQSPRTFVDDPSGE